MAKPEIRLQGFEGEWKECPLGDITTSFSGGTPSAGVAKYYGGNIPFIRSGEIAEDKTQLFITEEGLKVSSAKIVEKGTLLYALYGATSGEVSISRINGAINQAILAIYPKKGYSSKYLSHYLRAKKDIIVGTLLQGGQGNLSGALVKSIIINLPESCNEQNAIAEYFEHIDNAIQSTSKKIVSLKQMKQACLVTMFPQVGETTPRVRFKGFEGEWKCLPMSEIFIERHDISTITDNLPQLSFTIEEGVIRPEDRKTNKRDFLIKDKSNKKYLVTCMDDIIYNPANVIYGAIHKNSLCDGVVSPIYKIFYTLQDPSFMECVVRRPEFIKEMTIYMEGTVQKLRTLKPEAFLKMSAYIAPSLEEQKKIGDYFRSLDKQISLQKQRLEKLKQIKAACLDKMFV